MPRRRPLAPDTRPRSTDPSLPCIRRYRFADGREMTEVPADYERRYREMLMQTEQHPDWKSDPTYNLRKDRRR